MYFPIYKKGDKEECGNYRTITLISYASKTHLRVLLNRLEEFLIPELPIEQDLCIRVIDYMDVGVPVLCKVTRSLHFDAKV